MRRRPRPRPRSCGSSTNHRSMASPPPSSVSARLPACSPSSSTIQTASVSRGHPGLPAAASDARRDVRLEARIDPALGRIEPAVMGDDRAQVAGPQLAADRRFAVHARPPAPARPTWMRARVPPRPQSTAPPAPAGRPVQGLRGRAAAQQLDQVRRRPEGVGDDLARLKRQDRQDRAVALGHQARRRRQGARVALGDPGEVGPLVLRDEPDRHRRRRRKRAGARGGASTEVHEADSRRTDQSMQDVVVS